MLLSFQYIAIFILIVGDLLYLQIINPRLGWLKLKTTIKV